MKSTERTRRKRFRLRMLATDPHCRYCGRALTLANSSVDHVNPVKNGGRTTPDNLALTCKPCNYRKGNEHPLLLLAWCLRVVECLKA